MSDEPSDPSAKSQADEGAMGGDPDEVLAELLATLAPAFALLAGHDEPSTVHLAAGDPHSPRATL